MFNGLGKRILIMFAVMQFVVLATGCQDMDNRSMGHGIVSDTGGMNDGDDIDYSTSMIINNALASSRAASIDSNKNSTVNKASISSKTTKDNEGLSAKNKVGTSKGNASTHRINSKSKASTDSNGNSKVNISKSRVSSSITHSSTRSVRTKR